MNANYSAIGTRLSVLVCIVLAGWIARRQGWLGEPATRVLGRLCVDVCFPCLTFIQMLQIVGRRPPAEQGLILLLGAVIMTVALGGGWLLIRRAPADLRRTAWLAAAMPNWIFFPLPIAALLYGADGLATVLLVNVTAQFYLWTTSVGILRGFRRTLRTGLVHLSNPGLLASVAGAGLAMIWPASRTWVEMDGLAGDFWRLVEATGSLTIPLSMLVTGSQMGAMPRGWRLDAPARRVIWARLLLIPFGTLAVLWALSGLFPLPAAVWRTAVMIAAMPVAVSCGVLVERYGGDRHFISQTILVTTVAAFATVPLLIFAGAWIFR